MRVLVVTVVIASWLGACSAGNHGSGGAGGFAGVGATGGVGGVVDAGGGADASRDSGGTGGSGEDPRPVEIAAGANHVCARRADGLVRCWGSNFWGQVGSGSFVDYNLLPRLVPSFPNGERLRDVVQLALGRGHSCARLSNGQVQCWGLNADDQVDPAADTPGEMTPTLTRVSDAVAIAANGDHNCAVLADATVECWGDNVHGQVGNGRTATGGADLSPVVGLVDVAQVALGEEHSCARLRDGTVRCWGLNDFGQVNGAMSTADALTPLAVPGVTAVEELALGGGRSCARLAGGTIQCWGRGDTSTPTQILGISNAVELDLGKDHVCARIADGSVRCWGANDGGQLGDGTTVTRQTPADVIGLTDAVEIALGNSHSCARRSDDSVVCWGNQWLGDGSNSRSTTPVTVNW